MRYFHFGMTVQPSMSLFEGTGKEASAKAGSTLLVRATQLTRLSMSIDVELNSC